MNIGQDLHIKWSKFKNDRRAYFSLMTLLASFLITLPAEFLCNVRPILLRVDAHWYFPALITYSERDFGGLSPNEPDYKSDNFLRLLRGEQQSTSSAFSVVLNDFDESTPATPKSADPSGIPADAKKVFTLSAEDFDETKPAAPAPPAVVPSIQNPKTASTPREIWVLWPPVRYDYQHIATVSKSGREVLAAPWETLSATDGRRIASSWVDGHYFGSDDRGRDVLARLIYGFRISMVFGLALAVTGTLLGCLLGGVQGYLGGWIDLCGQRLTEIWGSMPRLYILIILSSFLIPSALLLFLILNLTAWMGIAAYIRAEFLKGRNLEYVKAARAMGVSDFQIMRRHILPNSLTPVITFFPFEVTAGILALVSLDFLNLGVPSPAPSIGELLAQGKQNLQATWIILPTFVFLTTALTLLTFVGDGIRNAFDPRKSS
jgi:ABC-type microcin C transport system permease subunit YejE